MPHVIVKLVPGKTEEQKQELADRIVESVVTILGTGADKVSVAMEEIPKEDWAEIYHSDIMAHRDWLYKRPGYTMPVDAG